MGKTVKGLKERLQPFVEIQVFQDSNEFKTKLYCYYIFQNVVDPTVITPKLFAEFVKGGSLSNKFQSDYVNWLKTEKGTLCRKITGASSLKLSAKDYSIFLNANAIENEGQKRQTALDHELLHIVFAKYKKHRGKISALWNNLTEKQKRMFKEKHPGYNFTNKKILQREYFSYQFQDRPLDGLELLAPAHMVLRK